MNKPKTKSGCVNAIMITALLVTLLIWLLGAGGEFGRKKRDDLSADMAKVQRDIELAADHIERATGEIVRADSKITQLQMLMPLYLAQSLDSSKQQATSAVMPMLKQQKSQAAQELRQGIEKLLEPLPAEESRQRLLAKLSQLPQGPDAEPDPRGFALAAEARFAWTQYLADLSGRRAGLRVEIERHEQDYTGVLVMLTMLNGMLLLLQFIEKWLQRQRPAEAPYSALQTIAKGGNSGMPS